MGGGLEHGVIRRRIALGFVHREHKCAAGLRELQIREQLFAALTHPVGIVLTHVRVRVEKLDSWNSVTHDLSPRR